MKKIKEEEIQRLLKQIAVVIGAAIVYNSMQGLDSNLSPLEKMYLSILISLGGQALADHVINYLDNFEK